MAGRVQTLVAMEQLARFHEAPVGAVVHALTGARGKPKRPR
ncbi:hypothetical protein ACU639_35995 [Streptomyces cynarae]